MGVHTLEWLCLFRMRWQWGRRRDGQPWVPGEAAPSTTSNHSEWFSGGMAARERHTHTRSPKVPGQPSPAPLCSGCLPPGTAAPCTRGVRDTVLFAGPWPSGARASHSLPAVFWAEAAGDSVLDASVLGNFPQKHTRICPTRLEGCFSGWIPVYAWGNLALAQP